MAYVRCLKIKKHNTEAFWLIVKSLLCELANKGIFEKLHFF